MRTDDSLRDGTPRTYLMCPPAYFDVTYAINPWMRPDEPADAGLAMRQWTRLRETYLRLRHTVHTIERGCVRLLQLVRHRDVGEDHAFLDQAMGVVAHAQLDGAHVLPCIDDEFRFGGVEVERSAARAGAVQRAVDVHQRHEAWHERTELGACSRVHPVRPAGFSVGWWPPSRCALRAVHLRMPLSACSIASVVG